MSIISAATNRRSVAHFAGAFLLLMLLLLLWWWCTGGYANSAISTTTYNQGDALTLWMDTVGPFNNPQERYSFATIPYCHPIRNPQWNQVRPPTTFLGEKVVGRELRNSGYEIRFRETTSSSCTTQPLTSQEVASFIQLLKGGPHHREFSTYRMYLEEFPLYGRIGSEHFTEEKVNLQDFPSYRTSKVIYKLYTTQTLIVYYTPQNSIVGARLEGDTASLVQLKEGDVYTFQIETRFQELERRDKPQYEDLQTDDPHYKRQVSIAIGCFLLAVVGLQARRTNGAIGGNHGLRGTKNALNIKLLSEDERAAHLQGNGLVGEPEFVQLLAALIGAGTQLLCVSLIACYQIWKHGPAIFSHGAIVDTFWESMILSSPVGGYVLVRIIRVYGEPKIRRQFEQQVELFQEELQLIPEDDISTDNESEILMMDATRSDNEALTSDMIRMSLYIILLLLPTLHTTILFWISIFSWIKGTTKATPFITFVELFWSWILVALPLYLLGAAIGHRATIPKWSSHHLESFPRKLIQSKVWTQILISGLITFIPVCYELLCLFGSLFEYNSYKTSPSLFVLIVISILVLNAASKSAVALSLAAGNTNQWHWIAYGCGAFCGAAVLLIGTYYWYMLSPMSGWYQQLFYWLFTIGISVDVAFLFGALSFWSGHLMVQSLSLQKSQ
eukprot:scaffold9520_cov105-Cylindrotheca_fusiformis.AAC.2